MSEGQSYVENDCMSGNNLRLRGHFSSVNMHGTGEKFTIFGLDLSGNAINARRIVSRFLSRFLKSSQKYCIYLDIHLK